MPKGICSTCKISLNGENSSLGELAKPRKARCRKCISFFNHQSYERNAEKRILASREYRKKYPEKVKKLNDRLKKSMVGRHSKLKYMLRKENVSLTDPLWNFNFYKGLVENEPCHYCLRALGPYGHGLDRMINEAGHVCFNVVPCCKRCNHIKSSYWEYEHMMLLAPKLRKMRQENLY